MWWRTLRWGLVRGGEVRAEVDELGLLVGEPGRDDHEDRAADRHDGPLLAAAAGDAPVATTEEGVGAAGLTAASPTMRAR